MIIKSSLLLSCLLATCFDVTPTATPSGAGEPPPETVFFSIDIKPLLDANCLRCHGGAGGLELDSYDGVITGGMSGAVVMPGDPVNSLIIRRLEGTVPPQMPTDDLPLPQPDIDRIAQWILEGARNN